MAEPMAGIRDASWYAQPRHDHGRQSTWQPVYHVEDEEYHGTPACAPNRALLERATMIQAVEVPEDARCRRPACRNRYVASPREHS